MHETPFHAPPAVEQAPDTEKRETVRLLNRAEELLMNGSEGEADQAAAKAWDKALSVLDPETIAQTFATAAILDILVAKIEVWPIERRLALAEAVLDRGGLETIFLKNWEKFPGIDERKIVKRAAERKAGFHLQKYAAKLTMSRAGISAILAEHGDARGAAAFAPLP